MPCEYTGTLGNFLGSILNCSLSNASYPSLFSFLCQAWWKPFSNNILISLTKTYICVFIYFYLCVCIFTYVYVCERELFHVFSCIHEDQKRHQTLLGLELQEVVGVGYWTWYLWKNSEPLSQLSKPNYAFLIRVSIIFATEHNREEAKTDLYQDLRPCGCQVYLGGSDHSS